MKAQSTNARNSKIDTMANTILYKFKDISNPEFSAKMINNKELWFARLSELNDPFEGDFAFEDEMMASRIKAPERQTESCTLEYRSNVISNFREKERRKIGVLSLTPNWNDIVMWSHYANYHYGICVGISFPEFKTDAFEIPENIVSERDKYIFPVKYSNNPMIISETASKKSFSKICLRKSMQWKYEQENRIMVELSKQHMAGVSQKLKNAKISEVIFGARCTDKEIDTFLRLIKDIDFKVSKAIFNHGHYRISKVPHF